MQSIYKQSLLLALLLAISHLAYSANFSLEELRWDHRIILIQAEQQDALVDTLQLYADEIEDRDIYWFVFTPSEVQTNYPRPFDEKFSTETRKKYFSGNRKNIILIGKDGSIKHRDSQLDMIFIMELIDSMPMRQQEMLQQEMLDQD